MQKNKCNKTVQNLYKENYNTVLRNTEEELQNWKDILQSRLEILISKMLVLPNLIHRLKVKSLTHVLCHPVGCPGSPVHGILQARILEWVAIFFSRGSPRPRDRTQVSRVAGRCFTLWAIECNHNQNPNRFFVSLFWFVFRDEGS